MALMSLVIASFGLESLYFSNDSDDIEVSSSRSLIEKKRVDFFDDCSGGKCEKPKKYIPVPPCSLIDKPIIVNHFSCTLSYKFTRMTYEKIRELISPHLSSFCYGFDFCRKPVKCFKKNIGFEVYVLLRNAINTVPPCLFDAYLKAFLVGDFSCCYLMLERYFSCDNECEQRILCCLQKPEDFRKCVQVNCIVFFDCISGETYDILVDDCPCEKPVCVYLPRQLLSFEEFLCLSFCVDEAILRLLSKVTGCDYAGIYFKMLKEYYSAFPLLTEEERVISFIRIKFFAFNAIAYQISFITTDKRRECIAKLLMNIKTCRNDLFFRSFAVGLGLLNK
jgi:hypothetical protein